MHVGLFSMPAVSVSVPSINPDDSDFEPDDIWKRQLRKRIEDSLASMIKDVKDNQENRLRKEVVTEHTRLQIEDEYKQAMVNIKSIATDQYRQELDRERNQRRWTAGKPINPEWTRILAEEQQSIMNTIKQNQDSATSQPILDNNSRSSLARTTSLRSAPSFSARSPPKPIPEVWKPAEDDPTTNPYLGRRGSSASIRSTGSRPSISATIPERIDDTDHHPFTDRNTHDLPRKERRGPRRNSRPTPVVLHPTTNDDLKSSTPSPSVVMQLATSPAPIKSLSAKPSFLNSPDDRHYRDHHTPYRDSPYSPRQPRTPFTPDDNNNTTNTNLYPHRPSKSFRDTSHHRAQSSAHRERERDWDLERDREWDDDRDYREREYDREWDRDAYPDSARYPYPPPRSSTYPTPPSSVPRLHDPLTDEREPPSRNYSYRRHGSPPDDWDYHRLDTNRPTPTRQPSYTRRDDHPDRDQYPRSYVSSSSISISPRHRAPPPPPPPTTIETNDSPSSSLNGPSWKAWGRYDDHNARSPSNADSTFSRPQRRAHYYHDDPPSLHPATRRNKNRPPRLAGIRREYRRAKEGDHDHSDFEQSSESEGRSSGGGSENEDDDDDDENDDLEEQTRRLEEERREADRRIKENALEIKRLQEEEQRLEEEARLKDEEAKRIADEAAAASLLLRRKKDEESKRLADEEESAILKEERKRREREMLKKEQDANRKIEDATKLAMEAGRKVEEARKKEDEINRKEEQTRRKEERLREDTEKTRRLQVEANRIAEQARMKQETLRQIEEETRRKEQEIEERERALKAREDEVLKREEEARRLEEEAWRKEEEARRKEEEVRRKEQEARRKEEEARRKEQEARRKEEEARRKEEEARRKEEEARKKEEEARRKEEEARKREEEAAAAAAKERQRREAEMKRSTDTERLFEEDIDSKLFLEEQSYLLQQAQYRKREEEIRRNREERKRQDSVGHDSAWTPSPGLSKSFPPFASVQVPQYTSSPSPAPTSASAWTTWGAPPSKPSSTTTPTSATMNIPSPSSSTRTPASAVPPLNKPRNGSVSSGTHHPLSASPHSATGIPPPTPGPPGQAQAGATPTPVSESEWARRHAEFTNDQQARFRREQERLEAERQLKAAGRPLSRDEVARLFEHHERLWARLPSIAQLAWADFPWPVLRPPAGPDDVGAVSAVGAYFGSAYVPERERARPMKERIKEHLRRWHPDRFESKVLPRVGEADRERVKLGAGNVVRCLNDLLRRENEVGSLFGE